MRVKLKPSIFRIKIDGIEKFYPEKTNNINWHNVLSFSFGSLLAISESMPFINNDYNGILQTLHKIQQEFKSEKF